MAAYNSEKHIEESICSIINQTYENFEFIIVNDGSTDNTPSIIKKYAKQDKRIRYINQKNIGLTKTLIKFIKTAIELREEAKFEFSKNVSDALSLIVEYSSSISLSREDIAYCNVKIFQKLYSQATKPADLFYQSVSDGKEQYSEALRISLPPLITEPNDVMFFEKLTALPNYITQKKVTAPVVKIGQGDELTGAIVCISNADPGFDWIFSHGISGLITAWGGANSHMAIRAGEFGLAAVIGAGEVLYSRWSSAKVLELDCAAGRVEIIR